MAKAELKEKPKAKMEFWTPTEKENSKSQYGCEIILTNVSLQETKTGQAPTDAQIVAYEVDGQLRYDLTRGSQTNLFDMYYDKFKQGLKDIQYGQGTVSPKLWGYRNKQAGKKKRRKG